MGFDTPLENTSKPMNHTEDFNFDWLFVEKDDANAFTHEFDDSSWRLLRLPHDWSVEHSFDPVNGDGATAYLPGGIGWYRKWFAPDIQEDQLLFVLFDGVYNNSQVWFNEKRLGGNPYGYSPFWFELTPHLKSVDQEQLLAIRVDHHRYIDSRWYTGSGIYRDVKLITKSKLHIPIWGTYLTTPEITETEARVELEIRVQNAFAEQKTAVLHTTILDPHNKQVAFVQTPVSLAENQESKFIQTAVIANPELWHIDQPNLYRAVTILQEGETVHEIYETPFGIRTIRFDVDEGFFLNGENMLIKGVCLHHDAGLVGTAVPDTVWGQRLATLKKMGCNAIRMAHNPSSEALLNLCDEMGFLVQVEFFDEWDNPKDKRLNNIDRHDDDISRGYAEYFQDWAEIDLKRTMLRDRNHPCVFQWSIGNEIEWTYPNYAKSTGYFDADTTGNYFWTLPPYSGEEIKARFEALPEGDYVLAKTARKLAFWTRELDRTRPIVANCILPSAAHVTGYADALDVVGYSYRQVIYDAGHAAYPGKVIMGTENLGQWHEWMHVIERPFISGLFFWTGIDYMGESHDKWPQKTLPSGFIDTAGFKKPSFYLMKSLWQEDPVIHLTTQTLEVSPYLVDNQGAVVEKEPGAWRRGLWYWHDVNGHWNYEDGTVTAVEVYTNCDEVELLLNGRSLGRQLLKDQEDRIFKWAVPFAPGILEAHGCYNDGQRVITQMQTALKPAAIQLVSDRSTMAADDYDVVRLVAQLVDAQGILVKHIEQEILFSVDGDVRILGVDNGSPENVQDYQTNRLTTSQGRALLIIQAKSSASITTVTASSGNLVSDTVEINHEN